MISDLNINDCTTPFDSAAGFTHLMPLTLYPVETKQEMIIEHLIPKDEHGYPTTYDPKKIFSKKETP